MIAAVEAPSVIIQTTRQLLVLEQEASNTQALSSLYSVVMTTTMPVRAEAISRPSGFGVSHQGTSSNADSLYVLSDFIPTTTVGFEGSLGGYLEYLPGSEYRLADMTSSSELKTLDIALWWQDRYGTLRPLNMPPNTAASIKLLLRKKSLGVFAEVPSAIPSRATVKR